MLAVLMGMGQNPSGREKGKGKRRDLSFPIGVNLNLNSCPTIVLPHPSIPSPQALRGGFGFRQNRGGVIPD